MNRWRDLDLDLGGWPAFDLRALPRLLQQTFKARRLAVELYATGTALSDIESRSGLDRRQIYRSLERCLAAHEDGRIFGWRGLVPHARVGAYERRAGMSPAAGGAGAFSQLMQTQPALSKWLVDSVHNKRISIDQLSTSG